MDPKLRALLDSPRVTAATRRVLEERLCSSVDGPRVLRPAEFARLVAWVEELRPQYPRPTAEEIAGAIDRRLAEGKGDGWRYDALPPDRAAFEAGLAGELKGEAAVRFREDLLAEVTEIAYAHPEVQFAIGYDGFADAQGWILKGTH